MPALRFPKLILGISRALDQKYWILKSNVCFSRFSSWLQISRVPNSLLANMSTTAHFIDRAASLCWPFLLCLYAFFFWQWACHDSFSLCSKIWLRNAVFAWSSQSKLIVNTVALEALCFGISHFPKHGWWSFHVDNLLLVLARSVPLNKVCKRFIAVFVHPQVPGVRERVDSDSICYVFVCYVSWFLRAFNARAHASIYIYIYIKL